MQPYFLPYIGYFQLIAAVDLFIVYDNIKYTKKGWINRNRMLQNGKDVMFSLPLKAASDALDIGGRELAADFKGAKLLGQLAGAYRRAPYFSETYPLLESILGQREERLFPFLQQSIIDTCAHLGIGTAIKVASEVGIDHALRSQDKVLALCQATGAQTYVNAIGGRELYRAPIFLDRGIDLKFIASRPFTYPQFGAPFVPWLSIVDVLMFNPLDAVRACVTGNYDLV